MHWMRYFSPTLSAFYQNVFFNLNLNFYFYSNSLYIYSYFLVYICFWRYQVCNGATFVNIDMGVNKKDGSKMLVIEGRFCFDLVFFLLDPPARNVRSDFMFATSNIHMRYVCRFLFADNGGGMDPDKMRHCMSLGYSVKSKIANTIGQCKTSFRCRILRFSLCLSRTLKSAVLNACFCRWKWF